MTVHISVDDVLTSLAETNSYMLICLKKWYYEYDAKFTLYCYWKNKYFSLRRINPALRNYNDFLKFGFHSRNSKPFANDLFFRQAFSQAQRSFDQMGLPITDCVRLHYWDATEKQKRFLKRNGIRSILSPDLDTLPYGADDTFDESGIKYYRTRVRFEELNELNSQNLHIGLNHIVAFTHEWCFKESAHKIEAALRIYKTFGYTFIN